MKYSDSTEKSAEYLRLALPLMTQQNAAMHRVSYAVWYEYVAGANATLTAKLDEYRNEGLLLDEQTTHDLYQRYVADINEDTAQEISQGMQSVMAKVSTSAEQASDKAGRLGDALGKWHADTATSDDIDAIPGLTTDMQDTIGTRKSRLDESRSKIEQLRAEVVKARAEKIRVIVERCRSKRATDNEAVANITISMGVACFRVGESALEFIARADAALYAAKSAGRNRVLVAAA